MLHRSNSATRRRPRDEDSNRQSRQSTGGLMDSFFGSLISHQPSSDDMRKIGTKASEESSCEELPSFLQLPAAITPPFFLSSQQKRDIFGRSDSTRTDSSRASSFASSAPGSSVASSSTPSPSSSRASTAEPSPAPSRDEGVPVPPNADPSSPVFTHSLSMILQALERDSEAAAAEDDDEHGRPDIEELMREPIEEDSPAHHPIPAPPSQPKMRAAAPKRHIATKKKVAPIAHDLAQDLSPDPEKTHTTPIAPPPTPVAAEEIKREEDPSPRHRRDDSFHRRNSHLRFHGWKHLNRPDVKLSEMELLSDKDVGVGQYGEIKLVTVPRADGVKEAFALKVINRDRFKSSRQEKMVLNEKLVMQSLDHPFHLQLINTYKTPTKLYVLTDYLKGGDLFDLIERGMQARHKARDRDMHAVEPEARKFYTANILLALKYMHELGIIHRDIKSANLLIGNNGYVKVCDYGLARFLPIGSRTKTLVGTYQYLAPEQCRVEHYDHSVDIWALGVTVYEMAFGITPFDVTESSEGDQTSDYSKPIIDNILKKSVTFPHHPEIGLTAKLFIKSLLTKDQDKRLGGDLNYRKVMESAWFNGIDWRAIQEQRVPAPWIPGQ